jgi:hypothetical protein
MNDREKIKLFEDKYKNSFTDTVTNGKRVYTTPTGNKYPSVTTVISAMSDHSGLDQWRERVGKEKAEEITSAACVRGTNMHKLIESYFKGDSIERTQTTEWRLFRSLGIYLKRLDPFALELPLWSDKLQIAGRTDCIGLFDNVLSVVDFKSSRNEKLESHIHNYFIQETVYALMAAEQIGINCKQIVTLIGCESGFPQLFRRKTDEFIKDSVSIIHAFHASRPTCSS